MINSGLHKLFWKSWTTLWNIKKTAP